jgi:hypothetical protein
MDYCISSRAATLELMCLCLQVVLLHAASGGAAADEAVAEQLIQLLGK